MCSPGLAHIRSFQFSYLFTHLFIHWPVEMSCGLRTLAALLEDHGLISSTHVATYLSGTPIPEVLKLSSDLQGHQAWA